MSATWRRPERLAPRCVDSAKPIKWTDRAGQAVRRGLVALNACSDLGRRATCCPTSSLGSPGLPPSPRTWAANTDTVRPRYAGSRALSRPSLAFPSKPSRSAATPGHRRYRARCSAGEPRLVPTGAADHPNNATGSSPSNRKLNATYRRVCGMGPARDRRPRCVRVKRPQIASRSGSSRWAYHPSDRPVRAAGHPHCLSLTATLNDELAVRWQLQATPAKRWRAQMLSPRPGPMWGRDLGIS